MDNDFGGSIEGNGAMGGIGGGNVNGSDGLSAGGGDAGGGSTGLDANANGGPGTVDLGSNSQSSSQMQFTSADAKALGLEALAIAGGAVAVARGSIASGMIGVTAATLANSSALATAMSHAAHDIGVSMANSPVTDPNNIGIYESTSEQATIDAFNADGGFGNTYPVAGGQVIDESVGGNVLATDHVAGGHSLYWDNFYQVNPYARVQF